jgi:hypothetical protein
MTGVEGKDEFVRRVGEWYFRGLYIDAVRLTRGDDGVSAEIDIVLPPGIGLAWPGRREDSETVFVFRCARINYFSWGGGQGVDIVDTVIDDMVLDNDEWRPMGLPDCVSLRFESRSGASDLHVLCFSIAVTAHFERPAKVPTVPPA